VTRVAGVVNYQLHLEFEVLAAASMITILFCNVSRVVR